MRPLVFLVLAALLCAIPACILPASHAYSSTFLRAAEDNVYLISVEVAGDEEGGPKNSIRGTGFPIDSHRLMTANHLAVMADNGQKVAVVTPHAASPMQGVVVKRGNETIDLAIIDVGQNVFAPFTFRTDSPAVGEELWIMGYGAGSVHPSAMHGIVSSSYDDLFDSLFPRIVTDAQGQHGHSGSPVLDRNGYVIGVLTQILRNGGQTSFAVPGTIAAKFAELR